jgi:hypothetical protein
MLFVSVLLTLILVSVLAVEAKQTNLTERGDLVWMGYDGHDYEIFLYSNGTTTQITHNDYDDWNPQINSKGQIVWQGSDGHDDEIFLYSKGTITQITDNDHDDYFYD